MYHAEKNKTKKLLVNTVYDFAGILTSAVIVIMILFSFIFRIVGVKGESMVPTLQDGDTLLVSASYKEVTAGDVIIITQPNSFNEPIVKRIIATEGQEVNIDFEKGEVYVDGVLKNEPYINELTRRKEDVEFPVVVPENSVFVMGDNRMHSTDSRSTMIGMISENYILGKVHFRPFRIATVVNGQMQKLKILPFSEWTVK